MSDLTPGFVPFLTRACLVAGPLTFAASTFFWEDGRYGATGGTLIALSVPIWAFGMIALLDRVRPAMPRYAAVATLVTLLGTVGGAGFGFQGFFDDAYGVDHDASLAALAEHPVATGLLLWYLGPLFPLALFALGVGLARTRLLPLPVGLLLCAGAGLFPASRIPRIGWVAHLVDLLLLVPFLLAALRWQRTAIAVPPRAPAAGSPAGD